MVQIQKNKQSVSWGIGDVKPSTVIALDGTQHVDHISIGYVHVFCTLHLFHFNHHFALSISIAVEIVKLPTFNWFDIELHYQA